MEPDGLHFFRGDADTGASVAPLPRTITSAKLASCHCWARNPGTDWAHPPPLHCANESILAFDGSLIAMPSQDEDIGIARDGLRGRASRQCDLSKVPLRYTNLRSCWRIPKPRSP